MKKLISNFSIKAFIIGLVVNCFLAGVVSYMAGWDFWYVFIVLYISMLINGLIMGVSEREKN